MPTVSAARIRSLSEFLARVARPRGRDEEQEYDQWQLWLHAIAEGKEVGE